MVKETPPQPAFASELRKYGLTLADRINNGTYGDVYAVKSVHSEKWTSPEYALKIIEPTEFGRQRLEEKGLTPSDLVNSEFLPPDQEHLIPRTIIQLGNNLQGVLMPNYRNFADHIFGERLENTAIRHFHRNYPETYNLNFFADVLAVVNEFTATKKRAHGDIKLENIALSKKNGEEKFLLGDYGSSHYADWSVPGKSGTRVGDPTIRAPELFTDKSDVHPTRESDAWSLGSLLFAITTNQELWENHVNYRQPVAKVGADLENFYSLPNVVEKELEKRIKEVPQYARDLVSSLLVLNPDKRKVADASLVEKTRKLARRYSPDTNIIDIAKSYGKFILATALGAAFISVMLPVAYEFSEFSDHSKDSHVVVGKTAIVKADLTEQITYERQLLTGKGVSEAMPYEHKWEVRDEAMATTIAPNDETYMLLWKALKFSTISARGGLAVDTDVVKLELYRSGNDNDINGALARRLKIALDNQRKRSTKIDLENVVVELFWGKERLEAAIKSGGENYTSYSQTKFTEFGDRIIPKDTEEIIHRTVDYVNAYFAARNPKLAKAIVGEDIFK